MTKPTVINWFPVDGVYPALEIETDTFYHIIIRREKKKRFRARLVDSNGVALAGEPFELWLPNGSLLEGTLSSDGTIEVEDVDSGSCRLRFPQLDAIEWGQNPLEDRTPMASDDSTETEDESDEDEAFEEDLEVSEGGHTHDDIEDDDDEIPIDHKVDPAVIAPIDDNLSNLSDTDV